MLSSSASVDARPPPRSTFAIAFDRPSGETVLHAGDEVVAVTLHESEEALREALMAPPAVRSF